MSEAYRQICFGVSTTTFAPVISSGRKVTSTILIDIKVEPLTVIFNYYNFVREIERNIVSENSVNFI